MSKHLLNLAGILLAAYTTYSSAAEVIVIKATSSHELSCATPSPLYDEVTVLVDNLAYQKQVFVHAKLGNVWKDLPLSYNRSVSNNKEIWVGKFLRPDQPSLEFAVKYLVNGKTYWDNNNGANYVLDKEGTRLFGTNISVEKTFKSASASQQIFENFVVVKHRDIAKEVKVVYSTDGWATTQPGRVTVSGPSKLDGLDTELWFVDFTFSPTATQVDYAFSYTVNGKTYWDNNFGRYYHAVVTPFVFQ